MGKRERPGGEASDGAILPHAGRDILHHLLAACHVMVFRVPHAQPVLVIHLDDEAVCKRVHAQSVNRILVPLVCLHIELKAKVLRDIFCPDFLLLRDIGFKPAFDQPV
ncbi:hypothetical protein SDC9_173247 [bioreactor metagenome]|uniref:Uncharacterized protein n=1 Tax=bioreactor metagenome TaxID=1076179 RepID=A0A645GFX0_9ZZZZ